MPNNKKIIPDATKYDYMSTAFMRQQINGQISENPTFNNSQISVPSFVKTAIITAIIEPAEEVGVKGQRFVEYQAEEVVQYFDETDGDMSWKKVSELTDNALGPDSGGLWSGGSLYEPFSNTFDYLIAFLNVKYQVGDIVTVSMLDNAYQPVELDSAINQIKSKDLGIPLHNWGQRWFITGGLPKDGSDTWSYNISDDRTAVEILQGSGAVYYDSMVSLQTAFPSVSLDVPGGNGLHYNRAGRNIQFSASSVTTPTFTADATSGEIGLFFTWSARTIATNAEYGFTTAGYPNCFTIPPSDTFTAVHGGVVQSDGYRTADGSNQNTSPITSTQYGPNDYDIWVYIPLVQYKAHKSADTVGSPTKYLIYDITPIETKTRFTEDFFKPGYANSNAGLFTGGCGIDITTNTGTASTTTLTFDIATADIAGAGLVAGTGTTTCSVDIGAGCGITVNANDIAVDRTALAGAGLTNGTGTCELAVGAGCAITVNANDIDVDVAALAGPGLIASTGTGCQPLEVVSSCGLTVAANDITVDNAALAGAGLVAGAGCALDIVGGCGIDVNANNIEIDLNDIAGAGIGVNTTGTGCDTLEVTATGFTYTEGCGINISTGDEISVDLYSNGGLTTTGTGTNCELMVKLDSSCGTLALSANGLLLDADALAGAHMEAVGMGLCQVGVDTVSLAPVLAGAGINSSAITGGRTLNLDIMELSTATPVLTTDYIAFGTTAAVDNEKALFTDFLEALTSFSGGGSSEPQIIVKDKDTSAIKWISGDKTKTQVLGHVSGVWQLIDTTAC
jgi:hypothetical protein|tara:strand:- start:454 stop:2826 length:2373 start_codon:yes stop_codon:yes gene_type:complete